jgi:hypothetical protein
MTMIVIIAPLLYKGPPRRPKHQVLRNRGLEWTPPIVIISLRDLISHFLCALTLFIDAFLSYILYQALNDYTRLT